MKPEDTAQKVLDYYFGRLFKVYACKRRKEAIVQNSEISYHELRASGPTQVTVNANLQTAAELEVLVASLRGPLSGSPGIDPFPPVAPPTGGPDPVEPPPTTRQPYFDLGDGSGKAGEIVSIPMLGGSRHPVNGFHIGGGLAGYGKLEAQGAKLGPFLVDYLKANGMADAYWSGFNMVKHDPHKALPTEWWDYAMAFFSLSQGRANVMPIQIPVDTLLFTVQIKILEETPPGEYELSCKDEFYYTHARPRRRNFLYTTDRDSEFASGGVTRIDTQGGILTVVA